MWLFLLPYYKLKKNPAGFYSSVLEGKKVASRVRFGMPSLWPEQIFKAVS